MKGIGMLQLSTLIIAFSIVATTAASAQLPPSFYVFTQGPTKYTTDFDGRSEAAKDVTSALLLRNMPVMQQPSDADVVVEITGRRGRGNLRDIFAKVVVAGATVTITGSTSTSSWQDAADHLARQLDDLARANALKVVGARGGALPALPSLNATRVPVFVKSAATDAGLTDILPGRNDSIRDLTEKIRRANSVYLVGSEADARIVLEVLGRQTDREYHPFWGFQNHTRLAVRLTVANYSTELVSDAGPSGLFTAYAAAAGIVVDRLEQWVKDNAARLAPPPQAAAPPQNPAPAQNPAPSLNPMPPAAQEGEDIAGWHGAEWGMTIDQVVKAARLGSATPLAPNPGAPTTDAWEIPRVPVGDWSATITFYVDRTRGLTGIALNFGDVPDFQRLRDELAVRYGQPFSVNGSRGEDGAGSVMRARWLMPRTEILCEYWVAGSDAQAKRLLLTYRWRTPPILVP
jgi:hypothetical protein